MDRLLSSRGVRCALTTCVRRQSRNLLIVITLLGVASLGAVSLVRSLEASHRRRAAVG